MSWDWRGAGQSSAVLVREDVAGSLERCCAITSLVFPVPTRGDGLCARPFRSDGFSGPL